MTPEAEALPGFKWAVPEAGTRHRLGGTPDWLQGDDTPVCRDCGEPMTFYAQLDSVNDEFNLADLGLVYVFACFDDFTTSSILQSR